MDRKDQSRKEIEKKVETTCEQHNEKVNDFKQKSTNFVFNSTNSNKSFNNLDNMTQLYTFN